MTSTSLHEHYFSQLAKGNWRRYFSLLLPGKSAISPQRFINCTAATYNLSICNFIVVDVKPHLHAHFYTFTLLHAHCYSEFVQEERNS